MDLQDQTTTTAPANEPAPAAPDQDTQAAPAQDTAPKTETAPAVDIDWADPEAIAAKMAEDAKKEGEAEGKTEDVPAEGEATKEGEDGKDEKSGGLGPQAPEAPPFWNEQAKAAWAKLPPEVKAEVRRVEEVREQFLNIQTQERNRAVEISEAIYKYAQDELTQAIQAGKAALEGEFGGIDWAALRQSNPELAVKLEDLASRRAASLQAVIDQQNELTKAGELYRLQEQDRYLAAQGKLATERVKAIVGKEFVADKWRAEAVEYLTKMGVPAEHISGLAHGYQLEVIAKAMQYDKLMGAAKTADNKLAAAPKVMPPKAAPAGSGDGKGQSQKAALDILKKDPNDNDNIARALDKFLN